MESFPICIHNHIVWDSQAQATNRECLYGMTSLAASALRVSTSVVIGSTVLNNKKWPSHEGGKTFLELEWVTYFSFSPPSRFLVSRSQCLVVRWFGKEKFRLSQNVLDTVYSQTLVMGGMFYAPLLPLLNLIFIFITFYIKKVRGQILLYKPQKRRDSLKGKVQSLQRSLVLHVNQSDVSNF